MSISSAPLFTASSTSSNLIFKGDCPLGKAPATHAVLTSVEDSNELTSFANIGYTQTAATLEIPVTLFS